MNKFSIIIPTFKRKENLLNLLKSFKEKLNKNTEIIIVEQGENNNNWFLERGKKLGLNVQYYFLETPSTPHAKNIGVTHANGDYVIFFDDDVLLKTKITPFLENFKDKSVAAVTGRSIGKGQRVTVDNKNVGKVSCLGTFSDGYSSKIPQEVDTVIGCNMAWSKDIFNKIGRFDEQFTGNALREESDLSLRARKAGYKILFDPKVEVFHDRAESGGARKTEGRLQWYFDFFSNETYFFLKHRIAFIVPLILLTRIEWALRCMFGFGREVSWRSIATPFAGIHDGYKKYERYKNENRD